MNQNEKKIVESIKNEYVDKTQEKTKFQELKSLDVKVKAPALAFAYTYGTLGALVLGLGMCFAMKVIGNVMALGIVIGLIGIGMVSTTNWLYSIILKKRKQKYADEIIEKSNELLSD